MYETQILGGVEYGSRDDATARMKVESRDLASAETLKKGVVVRCASILFKVILEKGL